MKGLVPCLHIVDRCLAATIAVSRFHFLSPLTMWERPHCPFCAMISVLRSAFLFSSLSHIRPLSISYYLSRHSATPRCSPVTCPLYPSPLPDCTESQRLCLLAVGQTSVRNWPIRSFLRPRPQHLMMSVRCATDILSRDMHAVMGWVEREGLSREACEERGSRQDRVGTTEANLFLQVPLS